MKLTGDTLQLILNTSGKRILIVGDVMLDHYISGNVDRISPEAPTPVLTSLRHSWAPGGAANVAMNVVGLGVNVTIGGFWGSDLEGQRLRVLLEEAGIDCSCMVISPLPTTSKTRVIARHQQLVRLDAEIDEHPCADHEPLLSKVTKAAETVDAIVLSDYAKGALTMASCRGLIDIARRRGVPILVDPKSRRFEKYFGATTICPNLAELAAATGKDTSDMEGVLAKAQQLAMTNSNDYLTVTMGGDGICLVRPKSLFHSSAQASEVIDICGAGDTVIAVLAVCLVNNISPEPAVDLANVAAGIVVGKAGTTPVTKPELNAWYDRQRISAGVSKLFSIEKLYERVAAWRKEKQSIVFTNGCFDILHTGHIELLDRCRQLGDRLIVALNTDASIRRAKGGTRPIVCEVDRARVIGAIAHVDAVVLFDDDTPISLIRTLRPEVLVKGDDYTEQAIVGAGDVLTWGGRVERVTRLAGKGTTNIIDEIIARHLQPDPALPD